MYIYDINVCMSILFIFTFSGVSVPSVTPLRFFPFWVVKPSLDCPFRLGRILSSTHGCVGPFQWKRQACVISRGKYGRGGREIGIDMESNWQHPQAPFLVLAPMGLQYDWRLN